MMAVAVTDTTSLVSNEEADLYFSGRLFADAWDAANPTTRDKALVTASRQIDAVVFMGVRAALDQPHAFPRTYYAQPAMDASTRYNAGGIFTDDGIPKEIQWAACEQAIHLLEQTAYERDRARHMAAGVSSIGIGGASEQFTPTGVNMARQGDSIGPGARRWMGPWLAVIGDLT